MPALPMTEIAIDIEVHRAIEARRASFDQTLNDILRGVFGLPTAPARWEDAHRAEPRRKAETSTSRAPRTRKTGSYAFILHGNRFQEESLNSAYKRCLVEISKLDSTFLHRLAEKQTRSRRIVAREPHNLYLRSPELAEKFAARLAGDWWVDVNLSQTQVETRLEIACEVAGLGFGTDLRLDFPE